ncbi:hypothetical protein SAMN05216188_111190 [Lentzea xinjiangensis]|uniref:BON domain-containing protein n=1 Tax=Lentzea xinjiangensis TaxID=402600 RepID=A0A1H9P8I7_9PSEU|nr:hypothetical protein [Lentzea xinjiangensis]SER44391.1 hypothetical protein SAMN05216188_111190 [Lentzea xinjiangensis]
MQFPQRVFVGALVVPALLASVGLASRPAPDVAPGQLVFAVRSSEIVLAGTASSAAERQDVVDAVRALTAAHRITDMITPNADQRVPVPPAVAASLLGVVLDQGVTEFTGVIHKGHLTASARVADPDRAGALSDALRAAAPDLRVDEDFTSD